MKSGKPWNGGKPWKSGKPYSGALWYIQNLPDWMNYVISGFNFGAPIIVGNNHVFAVAACAEMQNH